jgi:predicted cation transporter
LALGVNVSNFLVLGKTSPLAYQVLGHLKTSVILILGFVVFHYQYNAKVIVGAALALGGVAAYTELGRRHKTVAVQHAVEDEGEEGEEGLLLTGNPRPHSQQIKN